MCPNKHLDADDRLFKGQLLATETYIGGKVEAIESGVFRSDIPCKFSMQPAAYQELIDRCCPTRRQLLAQPIVLSADADSVTVCAGWTGT